MDPDHKLSSSIQTDSKSRELNETEEQRVTFDSYKSLLPLHTPIEPDGETSLVIGSSTSTSV